MKTFEERYAGVMEKARKKKIHRRIASGCVAVCCTAALMLALFVPLAPPLQAYAGSPYYSLIEKIYERGNQKNYKNNFEKLKDAFPMVGNGKLTNGTPPLDMDFLGIPEALPEEGFPNGSENDNYQEVTDNQVAGVTEADVVKRSDRYIYHLYGTALNIYSIAGENSQRVGFYETADDRPDEWCWTGLAEMYLSEDCSTITIIRNGIMLKTVTSDGRERSMVCVTNLDVTDPANIRCIDKVYMSGSYLTSRVVEGDLLLMGRYVISYNPDFSDEASFLPQFGHLDDLHSVAADDIYAPEELTSTSYTVVCKLDGRTLAVKDSAAYLSYSDAIYVSGSRIYATRRYRDGQSMTEISALDYSGDTLEHAGSCCVAGTVKNQYSMDENDGILRVVTSTDGAKRSASLYCISLEKWETIASVENFAPNGESAESVRFDGDAAYVCTAVVVTLTDPVYFFDLSDLSNITVKDTGVIQGYSTSLVDFGEGYLLGVGYNENRCLKIEIYQETDSGVRAVCAFESADHFSENYKSYLIDREHQIIGLPLECDQGQHYLLLAFDGCKLITLADINEIIYGDINFMRGILVDGDLYVLGGSLIVKNIW